MNKISISLFLVCCIGLKALAQTSPGQPSPNYNGQNYSPNNYSPNAGQATANNQSTSAGGLTFSNQVGQTFSANQLATQLQNLRAAVDQALPLLSAFNQSYSNSAVPGKPTVGGALSGIVSDVLHRNQATSQNSGQASLNASNLLGILRGLLNTNSNGSIGTAPGNAEDLKTLENNLQPVAAVLQRLNISPSPSPDAYRNGEASPAVPNQSLSPTGR